MRTNKFIKKCGPYKVVSISQDGRGVRFEIYPAFPEYDKGYPEGWAISRLLKGEGGGPDIFTVMALAGEFETFLNQPYSPEEIKAWKEG